MLLQGENVNFLASETFRFLGDNYFSFLWDGVPVFGYYHPEYRSWHIISQHEEEVLEEINDWIHEVIEERFKEEYDNQEGRD